jgi:hypothetical protein
MAFDIFKDPTKNIPKNDSQIVRVNMEEIELGGRKSQLPPRGTSAGMSIRHVSTSSTK